MKKPLILLVDDDRSVLMALETAILARFADIACTESFDDPSQVLEATLRWEADNRRLAVAVCDQKMPGMTGVELLMRLRSSPSAEHMRAIQLTGHAGLDSALRAKNAAHVDRYVEKPWDSSVLETVVGEMLARFLQDCGAWLYFTVNQVRGVPEMRHLLRMRYAVFCQASHTSTFLPATDSSYDVDAYDVVAMHLAVSRRESTATVVGGMRIVTGKDDGASEAVLQAVRSWPELLGRAMAGRTVPLPLMMYLIDAASVQRVHDRLIALGERVVEPGRLVVDPGVRLRQLGKYLVESSAAVVYFVEEVGHAILTCLPSHARIYESLGFQRTDGTEPRYHAATRCKVDCLHGARTDVPAPVRERLMAMAARFKRTGATCHCATYPACLPGPYATGEFADTDLFCPIRAGEVLGGGRSE